MFVHKILYPQEGITVFDTSDKAVELLGCGFLEFKGAKKNFSTDCTLYYTTKIYLKGLTEHEHKLIKKTSGYRSLDFKANF